MQLTENTLQILKNFASINPNIVINAGTTLRTISEARNVLASAESDVEFPVTLGIYDLGEFLSVASLVNDPDFEFNSDHILISDGTGRTRIVYHCASLDILTSPKKEIIMPEADVMFDLDRDTLNRVKRAASVLGHSEISVSKKSGESIITMSVIDSSDKTSNVYNIDIADSPSMTVHFNFVFNISNLKMVEGDYTVRISSKLISHFVNKDMPVQYWVSLEKTSTFGG